MQIYSTKHALTGGIGKHEARISGDMAIIEKGANGFTTFLHGEGKDWHLTLESAMGRAEEMRIRKLQSLDKQIKKYSSLVFKDPE